MQVKLLWKKFEEKKTMLPNWLWPFSVHHLLEWQVHAVIHFLCFLNLASGALWERDNGHAATRRYNNTNMFLCKKAHTLREALGRCGEDGPRFLECAAGCVTSVTSTKSGVTLIYPRSLSVNAHKNTHTHRPISSWCGSQPSGLRLVACCHTFPVVTNKKKKCLYLNTIRW